MSQILLSYQASQEHYKEMDPKEEISKIILEKKKEYSVGEIHSYTHSTIVFETFIGTPFNKWNSYLLIALTEKFKKHPFYFTVCKIFEGKGGMYFDYSNGDLEEDTKYVEKLKKL